MVTKEFEVAIVPGLPECRFVMDDSSGVPFPVMQTRSTTIRAILVISQLDDVSEEFWSAVRECILVASAGAFVAGMLPGGLASIPVFMQLFGSCAASKGFSLISDQLQLRTETTYGEWV